MISGDRVRLTQRAAAARMRFVRPRVRANMRKTTHCGVNWYERAGTVRTCRGTAHRHMSGSTNVPVIWDGVRGPEYIPVQALEVITT